MAERAEKRINFLDKYLEGLESGETGVESQAVEPTAQIVQVLSDAEKHSVEDIHAATGLSYTEIVPGLKTLDSLGLAKLEEGGEIASLTPEGVIVKREQFG
jgi:hypothetical protein